MQEAISLLYGHIVRFLIRAKTWYEQCTLRHAWEALARPVELQYDDLIEDVLQSARQIDTLATAGSQAEQRDMHLKIRKLSDRLRSSEALLQEIRSLFISMEQNEGFNTSMLTLGGSTSCHSDKREPGHQSATYRSSAKPDHGHSIELLRNRPGQQLAISCLYEHQVTKPRGIYPCSTKVLDECKVSGVGSLSTAPVLTGYGKKRSCK